MAWQERPFWRYDFRRPAQVAKSARTSIRRGHAAQHRQAPLQFALELIVGAAEGFIAFSVELALLGPQAGDALAVELGKCCLVGVVNLAVEPRQVRIRA